MCICTNQLAVFHDLPQPKIKKNHLRFILLPNTVINIMYSITPSHNIQQKADVKKYCSSAATITHETCVQLHMYYVRKEKSREGIHEKSNTNKYVLVK